MELTDAKEPERAEHRGERGRVEQEDPPGTNGRDEDAGGGGADHACGVERGGVQRDRVREVGLIDQLGHERLARRRIERRDAAVQQSKHVDVPHLDEPEDGEAAQAQGQYPHRCVRGDQ